MNNWKETTLGSMTEYINRGIAPVYSSGGVLVLNQRCVRDKRVSFSEARYTDQNRKSIPADKLLRNGDILICSTGVGTLGRVGQLDDVYGEVTVDSHVSIVRANNDTDPRFLAYLLKWKEKEIEALAEGSTGQTELPRRKLIEYKISVPESTGEQKKIAGILGSLDDKIELLRKENETLEKLAQTLFKRWFVDFEFPADCASLNHAGRPVSSASPAKGGERGSVKGYKSSGGKMIDSKLGPIPEGWRVESLTTIATFLNGLAMQKFPAKNVSDSFPVIKIKEMSTGITDQTDRASKDVPEKYIVNFGDVLFSWSGSLDIDVWKHDTGVLNQHLFKVTSESYPKWFYFYWIKEHLSAFQQIATAKAVTMGHIQRHHLDDALVVIPDEKYFCEANYIFVPLFEKMLINHAEIKTLSRSRDMLLPKLMSGEIQL